MDFAQPPDCNPNPSDECLYGADDHPCNVIVCADCQGLRSRDEVSPWGDAYICDECLEFASRLPFEEDEEE